MLGFDVCALVLGGVLLTRRGLARLHQVMRWTLGVAIFGVTAFGVYACAPIWVLHETAYLVVAAVIAQAVADGVRGQAFVSIAVLLLIWDARTLGVFGEWLPSAALFLLLAGLPKLRQAAVQALENASR